MSNSNLVKSSDNQEGNKNHKVKYSPSDFVLIGCNYKRIIEKPITNSKGEIEGSERLLKDWNEKRIKDRLGSVKFSQVEEFDEFTIVPSHVNFQRAIENGRYRYYNKYEPLNYRPKEGEWPYTEKYLKHILGQQYELGIDYLAMCFQSPMRRLPALVLASKESNTGKSTFIRWLNQIFGFNLTRARGFDLSSRFNDDQEGKLFICYDDIEEIPTGPATETLKNNITDYRTTTEGKSKDKRQTQMFAKFIITTNRPTDFIKISPTEDRFWIRIVPPITERNQHFEEKIKEEIPAFLFALQNRKFQHKTTGRLCFDLKDYETEALKTLKKNNVSNLQKEIKYFLSTAFSDFEAECQGELKYTPSIIKEELRKQGSYFAKETEREISTAIKAMFSIQPREKPSTFTVFEKKATNEDGGPVQFVVSNSTYQGKYFVFKYDEIKDLVEDFE